MAYIVRDTGAFLPGQPQVGGPQGAQDPQRAQRAAGWLQLANAAASSPLLGALLRGGQAIKHGIEDSQLKAAAARKVARERAAVERSPVPLADTGGGFTLQEPEGETIFGKGALSQEPPAPSWLEPKAGGDRWDIQLPEGEATPAAPAPAPTGESPAAGPSPDVARGEAPGGPAEARAPSAVGIEPEAVPADLEGLNRADPEAAQELINKRASALRASFAPGAAQNQNVWARDPGMRAARALARIQARSPEGGGIAPDYRTLYAPDRADLGPYMDRARAEIATEAPPEPQPVQLGWNATQDGAAIPMHAEVARDTSVDALRVANDPALRGIESKPPELLNRAIAALESANTPLARSRAEAIRQELRRREQAVLDAQEVEQIRDDDETLAAAPVEVEDVWSAAKVADTPEKQAKVLEMIPRARTTVASLEDLIGSGREERLMAQAQQLFPHAPAKSEAQVAAEIAYKTAQAESAEARAEFLRGIKDPKIRATVAQAMRNEELGETEEALRPEREDLAKANAERARAGAEQAKAKAAEINKLVDDREKLLQEQAKTQEALRKKWADALALARAKVRAGRAGGSAGAAGKALKDALKQATALREANEKLLDRNAKEIPSLDGSIRQAEAEIQAHSRVAEAGVEPTKPTSADGAVQAAYLREKAAYDKRVQERENAQAQIVALETARKAMLAQRDKLAADVDAARRQNREELEPLISAGVGGLAKSLGIKKPETSTPITEPRPPVAAPVSRKKVEL